MKPICHPQQKPEASGGWGPVLSFSGVRNRVPGFACQVGEAVPFSSCSLLLVDGARAAFWVLLRVCFLCVLSVILGPFVLQGL